MRWANFFHIYQPPHWPRAIIAKVARESYRPLTKFLLAHEHIRITLNISGSLTEQLSAHTQYRDIINGLRKLLSRGQVELVDSAMYHAILPLLPEPEIERQIVLNRTINRRVFGRAYAPRGFFPPEMAYGQKLADVLTRLKYSWVILDGISNPGIVDYTKRYEIKKTGLQIIFRNRYVSDYLAFAVQEADTRRFLETVKRWNSQRDILITAMDGENLGHHRHIAKRIWQQLVHQPHVDTVTVSELIRSLPVQRFVVPRASSWSTANNDLRRNIPFALWKNPSNGIHRLQWELFGMVYELVRERESGRPIPAALRKEFDQASSSDWYWWASCEPWWDVNIIVQAAQRLRVLGEELTEDPGLIERIRQYAELIGTFASRWERTGLAERNAKRFLKHEQTPRYLGGKSVN